MSALIPFSALTAGAHEATKKGHQVGKKQSSPLMSNGGELFPQPEFKQHLFQHLQRLPDDQRLSRKKAEDGLVTGVSEIGWSGWPELDGESVALGTGNGQDNKLSETIDSPSRFLQLRPLEETDGHHITYNGHLITYKEPEEKSRGWISQLGQTGGEGLRGLYTWSSIGVAEEVPDATVSDPAHWFIAAAGNHNGEDQFSEQIKRPDQENVEEGPCNLGATSQPTGEGQFALNNGLPPMEQLSGSTPGPQQSLHSMSIEELAYTLRVQRGGDAPQTTWNHPGDSKFKLDQVSGLTLEPMSGRLNWHKTGVSSLAALADSSGQLQGNPSALELTKFKSEEGNQGSHSFLRYASMVEDLQQLLKVKWGEIRAGQSAQMRIQVKPDHLGELDIRLTSQEGKLTIQILAFTRTAAEALDRGLYQLQTALVQQGILVEKIEVNQNQPHFSPFTNHGQNGEQSTSGEQKQGRHSPHRQDEEGFSTRFNRSESHRQQMEWSTIEYLI